VLLIAVAISRLVKKGEKIDEPMTKPMPLGNLIAISLKNAIKNFSKYLILVIITVISFSIGIGITFSLRCFSPLPPVGGGGCMKVCLIWSWFDYGR
jgi:hypothetical protein